MIDQNSEVITSVNYFPQKQWGKNNKTELTIRHFRSLEVNQSYRNLKIIYLGETTEP